MTENILYGKGCLVDAHDDRDLRFSLDSLDATKLAKKFTWEEYMRPEAFDQGQIGSCHDDKTEVLTDSGFKLFKDVKPVDLLATVNPDTSELSYEKPTRMVRFPYVGPLYCVSGQNMNFRVTPDHKMLVRTWNQKETTLNDDYQLIPMKDVGWYSGFMNRVNWKGSDKGSDTFTLKGVTHKLKKYRGDMVVSMKTWLKFLGIYLAEGTMLKREQGKASPTYKIQLAATKDREKEFIREVLSELGIRGQELSDRFTFENKRIYEAMSALGLEGVKAGQKFVPSFVFEQSAENVQAFLDGHLAGDGCVQNGHRSHYTGSPQVAKDLQTLVFLSGNESYVGVREPRTSMTADGRTITGSLKEHRISVCEQKHLSLERKKQVSVEMYNGEVFCAEVPTHHTLVTRREGRILISGNCTGNGSAGAFIILLKFTKYKWQFTPSRLKIYYDAREIEGTVHEDAGAQIRDVFKGVNLYGIAPEDSNKAWSWPYSSTDNRWKTKPPKECYDDAKLHVLVKYERVTLTEEHLKAALMMGPVVFGMQLKSSFESSKVAKNGMVPDPKGWEQNLGGHCMLAYGYGQKDPKRVDVRNSWGKWGDNGNCHIPFDMFEQYGSDAWQPQLIEARLGKE